MDFRSTGKCEGRKIHAEANPNAVKLARKLHRLDRATHKHMSYRDIAETMASRGHLAGSGKPYGSSAICAMLGS